MPNPYQESGGTIAGCVKDLFSRITFEEKTAQADRHNFNASAWELSPEFGF